MPGSLSNAISWAPIFRVFVLTVVLSGAHAGVAGASEGDTAAARSLATQGIEAFRDEKYEEAIDLFRRAEAVLHAPTHLLFMARAHKELGHPVDAYELYNKVLREKLGEDAPAAFVDAQNAAQEEIRGLEEQISFATIKLSGVEAKEATVFIDDKEIAKALLGVKVPVNPGQHVVRLEGQGLDAEPVEFSVAPSKHEVVRLVVRNAPGAESVAGTGGEADDRSERIPAYLALGVGAAGVVVGGVFAGIHFGKKGKANSRFDEAGCADTCFQSDYEDIIDQDKKAARAGTVSLVAFGVGATGLTTGVTLLLLRGGKSEPLEEASREATLQPAIGWGTVGLRGSF